MGYQTNNNPWGNHPSRNKGNNTLKYPDFLKLLNTLHKKLWRLNIGRNNSNRPSNPISLINILYWLVIITIIIWLISGLYTIQELDRGVVTRFGKFNHLVNPGLNWKLNFIDTVQTVNVSTVRDVATEGIMLTSDENVVHVEMNVQYRVSNPKLYLFSVNNPDDSLSQATDSVLRGVIGKYSMDEILTEGRTIIRSETQRDLEKTLNPYHMGITLVDVNFQAARPPEEVKAAFDDAIAALENEQQYIREAEAYANEVQPQAQGKAQRILADARAYKIRIILEAQGEVTGFNKILPEYKFAPKIARERLYIETMEHIFSNTKNVLINDKGNNIFVLPYVLNQSDQTISSIQNNDNNQKLSQKLIPSLSGKESPSALLSEKENPSTSLLEKENPSASLSEKESPSASLLEKENPSASLSEKENPSASLSGKESPSASLLEKENPSASLSEKENPSASLSGKERTSSPPHPDSDFSQRQVDVLRNSPRDIGYTEYKRAKNA